MTQTPPHLENDLNLILSRKLNVIKTSMNRENISFLISILKMILRKLSGH